MAERTWFEGPLPAIATDTLAVIVGGAAVAAARRVLSTGTMPGTPEILDALLADGIAAVPAFAVVALDDDRLTAFVRGEFVLRFEDRSRRVWRVDGVGAHTWREVEAASVVRAWAGAPDAEPKLFDLGPTPERPVRVGPTTAAGIMLRGRPAVVRPPIPSTAPPAAAPPAAAAPPRPRPAAAEPADDETVVTSSSALAPKPAPRTPRAPRAIELPGGDIVPIHGTLLVGRGPRSSRVEGDDLPTLVALGDVSRDVSRAHVKIWTDGTRVQIEDLATPGGTAVIDADGVARLLVPDRAVEVREGASAELAGGARIRFVGDA